MADTEFILKSFDGQSEIGSNETSYQGKCLLPPFYSDIAEKILNSSIRKDDVWVISFPRTGSTWLQEIVWLIGNNLDFAKAKTVLQQLRAPLIETSIVLFEYSGQTKTIPQKGSLPLPLFKRSYLPFDGTTNSSNCMLSSVNQLFTDSASYVEKMTSPRFIKSHLPVELLPTELLKIKPKVIYIMRNPKDLCVSFYHYCKLAHKLHIDFNYFCELFMNDALPIGSVFNHYFGFWNRREQENILIIKYEDLIRSPRELVKNIGQFMEKSLNDEDIDAICNFLTFQNMKENKACNLQLFIEAKNGKDYYQKTGTHFIRKGIVGDHKNVMSEEIIRKFDKWIEENTKGSTLHFGK